MCQLMKRAVSRPAEPEALGVEPPPCIVTRPWWLRHAGGPPPWDVAHSASPAHVLRKQAALEGGAPAVGCPGGCASRLPLRCWPCEAQVIQRHQGDASLPKTITDNVMSSVHRAPAGQPKAFVLSHLLLAITPGQGAPPTPWKAAFQVSKRETFNIWGFHQSAEIHREVKYQSFLSAPLVSTFNRFYCCNFQKRKTRKQLLMNVTHTAVMFVINALLPTAWSLWLTCLPITKKEMGPVM